MSLNIEKEVEIIFDFDYEMLAKEVVSFAMEYENFPYEAEVNLTLTDNSGIHIINKMYRDIDAPTDVLSFPMLSYTQAGDFSALEEEYEDYGHSERREYAFLIVHSMLHLFGYDHMTEEEAAVMEEKQHQILDAMHISRD